jgi:hypothetical protein
MESDLKTFHLNMQEYLSAYRSRAMVAAQGYPMSESDVDARVYVSLISDDRYEEAETPLEDYIANLREIAAMAPDGVDVVIEFERDYGYDDDTTFTRKVGYWRDPTPEERLKREAHNREARAHNAALAERAAAATAEAERLEYERLKEKYGTTADPER